MTLLRLDSVRLDGGTQPRAAMNKNVIEEYGGFITDGAVFPAVTVFYDGAEYWLADGFHRFQAHREINALEIDADVKQGSKRDAVLYSVGANSSHGLRRTNDDKKRAVKVLLEDSEWTGWSDREIARRCGVSHEFVRQVRPQVSTVDASDKRKGADGKSYSAKQKVSEPDNTSSAQSAEPELESEPLFGDMELDESDYDGETGELLEPEQTIPAEVAEAGFKVAPASNANTQLQDALNPIAHDEQVDRFLKLCGELAKYRDIAQELRSRPRYVVLGGETLYRQASEVFILPTKREIPTIQVVN